MDSDSDSIRVNKRSKNTYDNPDLISNIPEFAISQILSFLPTKDAVRTSVLSKRWKSLWTSIIELSFDDKNVYSSPDKKRKITKVLFLLSIYLVLLHLKSLSLESFKLYLSRKYDPYHINRWISTLSVKKVKKIHFICKRRWRNILSDTLLKCHSLEELCLQYCDIQIPNLVSHSSLTVLKLVDIEISNVGNPADKLTLNLPSLKKYTQESCSWVGVNAVSFEVPQLEVLRIGNYFHKQPEMVFSAVSLTELYYNGCELKQTSDLLAMPVHVASADIGLGSQGMRNSVCKLLTTNVQRLKLVVYPSRVLAEMEYIPSFGRLVHLEMQGSYSTKFLLDFLLKASCLQTLILMQRPISVKEKLSLEIVPDCLYTLKVVKFKKFQGKEHELNIAKFLMENAKVLEQITFSYYCLDMELGKKKLEKYKERLFSFKKRSRLARIEFIQEKQKFSYYRI